MSGGLRITPLAAPLGARVEGFSFAGPLERSTQRQLAAGEMPPVYPYRSATRLGR